MRKIIITVLCCLGLFATIPAAHAAVVSTVDPVVIAVQKRYAAIKSMRAEFMQTLIHKESGNKETRTGVLYFAKPLLVRWETKTPIPELLLVTKEAVWNAFPDEDMAYKYPPELSAESSGIMQVVTGQGDWAKEFDIENKGTEKGMTRLVLYPKNPTQSMTEAELLAETKTGRITYVCITDFYYNRNEITFTSQEFDQGVAADTFTFTPPKGMKVEDRTKGGAQGKPLLQ
ncbi:MAG: Outer-membrane lipoprotein carrier protein [Desulfovibrio sp.]